VQPVEQLEQLQLVLTAPRDFRDLLELAELLADQLHATPSARTAVDTTASRPLAT
jgi:hypothetical protein